ncbi:helix-turn-helix domain-containing protein [Dactylosporangium aurantiacum]|uniref:Helix-turn-helix domain-containing protein n=1 Tax=Dactylosporangium aurantiacum TaxID=35754 RepID=A0A9Q9INM2_9ACTN|nr:helix-turn-helix domain-containing protein [Dactylosporangium aurantiacum]MDG6104008.1 helix-turn-helix domain-containing protein [Dactylosporangium aurantiacum]UWZ58816.1 helix-turn-helix domain-containing protein [Dactylosporangium aurantiacum]
MSIRVMTWVWDSSPVGGNDRLVLLAIADNAADDGTNAWPSLHTLARKTLLDVRTVRRIVRRLEEGGHLHVALAAGPGGVNRYTVVMQQPGTTPTPAGAAADHDTAEHPQTPPDRMPGGQDVPGQQCPGTPDTMLSGAPGHSCARRTSNTSKNGPRARERRRSDGAASPPMPGVPRCTTHPQQPAQHCGPCRSERLAGNR